MIKKVQTKSNQCLFLDANHGKKASGQIFKYTALVFNNQSSAEDEKLPVKRIFFWTFSTQCAQEHHVLLQGSLYCSSSKVSYLQGLLHMDFLIFLFLLYL